MGLLEKRNPHATRRSVVWWACGCGVAFFVFGLVMLIGSDMPTAAWFFMLPWMTVAGAVSGAAMEWQLPE